MQLCTCRGTIIRFPAFGPFLSHSLTSLLQGRHSTCQSEVQEREDSDHDTDNVTGQSPPDPLIHIASKDRRDSLAEPQERVENTRRVVVHCTTLAWVEGHLRFYHFRQRWNHQQAQEKTDKTLAYDHQGKRVGQMKELRRPDKQEADACQQTR